MHRLIEVLRQPGMKIYLLVRPLWLTILVGLACLFTTGKYDPSLKELLEFVGAGMGVAYLGALIFMLAAILKGMKRTGS